MTKKIILALLAAAALLVPYAPALAASTWTQPQLWPTGYWGQGGLLSCTGNPYTFDASGVPQPHPGTTCTNLCDLVKTAINIIYFAMTICIFALAPIFAVAGGVMIMLAGPNPEMLSKAKKLLTGTVIGIALILGSYLIINTFVQAIGITGVGGFFGGGSICPT